MAQDPEKCPSEIVIDGKKITSGGVDYFDDVTKTTQYEPYTQGFTIPANSVCMTTISVPVDPISFPGSETEGKKGAWSATEWESEVYVMMTKLTGDQDWDETNSAMYSAETYYYNNREGETD